MERMSSITDSEDNTKIYHIRDGNDDSYNNNGSSSSIDGVSSDVALYEEMANAIWKYVAPTVLVVGTLGSILSLLVLCRRPLRKQTTMFYLAVLAVADLMVLYAGLIRLWLENAMDYYIRLESSFACKTHTFFVYLSLDFSVWILVAVSADRCVMVALPHKARQWCSLRYAWAVVLVIILFVSAVNAHFFWTHEVGVAPDNSESSEDAEEAEDTGQEERLQCYARNVPSIVKFVRLVWPWIDFSVYCLIPIFLISACNVIIVRQLIRADKRLASHRHVLPRKCSVQKRPSSQYPVVKRTSRVGQEENLQETGCEEGTSSCPDDVPSSCWSLASSRDTVGGGDNGKNRDSFLVEDDGADAAVRKCVCAVAVASVNAAAAAVVHDDGEGNVKGDCDGGLKGFSQYLSGANHVEKNSVCSRCDRPRVRPPTSAKEEDHPNVPDSPHGVGSDSVIGQTLLNALCVVQMHTQPVPAPNNDSTPELLSVDANANTETFGAQDNNGDSCSQATAHIADTNWSKPRHAEVDCITSCCSNMTRRDSRCECHGGAKSEKRIKKMNGKNGRDVCNATINNCNSNISSSKIANDNINNRNNNSASTTSINNNNGSSISSNNSEQKKSDTNNTNHNNRNNNKSNSNSNSTDNGKNSQEHSRNNDQTETKSTGKKKKKRSVKKVYPDNLLSISPRGSNCDISRTVLPPISVTPEVSSSTCDRNETDAGNTDSGQQFEQGRSLQEPTTRLENGCQVMNLLAMTSEGGPPLLEVQQDSPKSPLLEESVASVWTTHVETHISYLEVPGNVHDDRSAGRPGQSHQSEEAVDYEKSSANSKNSGRENGTAHELKARPKTNNRSGVATFSRSTAKWKRNSTQSVSITLLVVSVTFWVLNAPIMIFLIGYTYWARDADDRYSARLHVWWAVVNMLQYLNNACHIFLYCLTGPRFRAEFRKMVGGVVTCCKQIVGVEATHR